MNNTELKYSMLIEGETVHLNYSEWCIIQFKIDHELDGLKLAEVKEGIFRLEIE